MTTTNTEHVEPVDVLIIGAGLAGIGGACQFRRNCPDHSFMVLESRAVSGGTWDLFRYPGIRSDSDMYTYSYGFKPWKDKSTIADGHKILSYIREAAAEYDVERYIRYNHKVVAANWSSADKRWLVTAERGTDNGESGERTPTYIANVPAEDPTAKKLRKWLPDSWVFRLTRWKKVLFQICVYKISRKRPETLRKLLLGEVRRALGPDYDVDTHFTPPYNPWDQRLCAVPDGDMFDAIREKRAEVVTDHIDQFNSTGIALKSGKQLDADLVILGTGLNLKFAGGIEYSIDDKLVDFTEHFVYRGMMFSDVPNMAVTVGYTNSSWTLKTDLTSKHVCRMLNKMAREGYTTVMPHMEGDVNEVPLLDFDAGYVLRARDQFPKQGDRLPWKNYQDYIRDFIGLRRGSLRDKELAFS